MARTEVGGLARRPVEVSGGANGVAKTRPTAPAAGRFALSRFRSKLLSLPSILRAAPSVAQQSLANSRGSSASWGPVQGGLSGPRSQVKCPHLFPWPGFPPRYASLWVVKYGRGSACRSSSPSGIRTGVSCGMPRHHTPGQGEPQIRGHRRKEQTSRGPSHPEARLWPGSRSTNPLEVREVGPASLILG